MIKKNRKMTNSYLSFKLDDETFAIHVKNVLNILEVVRITKVPKSPEYMAGVINLRGIVLPVIDTRLKFGMSAIEITPITCVIVLSINIDEEDLKIGVLVDAVQEVLEVEDSRIEEPPSIGAKYKSEFISGMIGVEDNFTMVLNIDKIFTSDEMLILKDNSDEVDENENQILV